MTDYATVRVGAGGAYKIGLLKVGAQGAWKRAIGMWVGAGGVWKPHYRLVEVNSASYSYSAKGPMDLMHQVYFNANGTVSTLVADSGTGAGTPIVRYQWLRTGLNTDYRIRFTILSDVALPNTTNTFIGGTFNTWMTVSSTRFFRVVVSQPSAQARSRTLVVRAELATISQQVIAVNDITLSLACTA